MYLFIVIFSLIYFLLNFYVLFKLYSTYNLEKNLFFYLLAILLTFSFVLSTFLLRNYYNPLTKLLYTFASLWLGIIFLFFSFFLLSDFLNLIFRLPNQKTGKIVVALVIILTIYSIINATFLRLKKTKITGTGINKKIIQISDLHVGTLRDEKYLKKVVSLINMEKPDLVLITGDMVSGSAPLREGMFDELNEIAATTYFVHGNHEVYEGVEEFDKIINPTNIRVLKDEVVYENGVQIIGLAYYENKDKINKTISQLEIDSNSFVILLNHIPIFPENNEVDLTFSGHTHNGQIFPFNLVVKIAHKYTNGLYENDGQYLHVSPGTGTWGPFMRLGSRNEITVVELE